MNLLCNKHDHNLVSELNLMFGRNNIFELTVLHLFGDIFRNKVIIPFSVCEPWTILFLFLFLLSKFLFLRFSLSLYNFLLFFFISFFRLFLFSLFSFFLFLWKILNSSNSFIQQRLAHLSNSKMLFLIHSQLLRCSTARGSSSGLSLRGPTKV